MTNAGLLTPVMTKDFIEESYARVRDYALSHDCPAVPTALEVMRHYHEGQYRNGGDVPYILHPLTLACHAISLGIADDDLLCVCLLHDVLEDTDAAPSDLRMNDKVAEAVQLLSFSVEPGFTKEESKARYYDRIAENSLAMMVKVLDRCNNVSGMALCFDDARLRKYIKETREHVLPLFPSLEKLAPGYSTAAFSVRYHIETMIDSIEALMPK